MYFNSGVGLRNSHCVCFIISDEEINTSFVNLTRSIAALLTPGENWNSYLLLNGS